MKPEFYKIKYPHYYTTASYKLRLCCQQCGVVTKRTGNCQKYCKDCGSQTEKDKRYYKKHRLQVIARNKRYQNNNLSRHYEIMKKYREAINKKARLRYLS